MYTNTHRHTHLSSRSWWRRLSFLICFLLHVKSDFSILLFAEERGPLTLRKTHLSLSVSASVSVYATPVWALALYELQIHLTCWLTCFGKCSACSWYMNDVVPESYYSCACRNKNANLVHINSLNAFQVALKSCMKWCQGPLLHTSANVIIHCSHTLRNTQWERKRERESCGPWQGKWMAHVTVLWVLDEEKERASERSVKGILNHKRVREWKIDGHVSSSLGAFRAGFSPSLRAHLTSCLF